MAIFQGRNRGLRVYGSGALRGGNGRAHQGGGALSLFETRWRRMNGCPYPIAAAPGAAMLTGGEVRKVDRDAQKITIRHGPIRNLDMPAMTMVFRVKDPAMLDLVKAGDKVKFAADNVGGALTVMQ